MTEEMQQQVEGAARNDSCSTQQNETQLNSDIGKVKDNKKEKCRPMTKVCLDRIFAIDADFCLLDKHSSSISRLFLDRYINVGYIN